MFGCQRTLSDNVRYKDNIFCFSLLVVFWYSNHILLNMNFSIKTTKSTVILTLRRTRQLKYNNGKVYYKKGEGVVAWKIKKELVK